MSEERPPGTLQPTPPGALAGCVAAGLVGGWLLHRLGFAPLVARGPVLLLFFVAAIVGWTAWSTWRHVQVDRRSLEPHRAVNRLVLAKSSALAGALIAGAYAGYALSWLGNDAELADQRIAWSLLAALAGALLAGAAMALERACRVHGDRPES